MKNLEEVARDLLLQGLGPSGEDRVGAFLARLGLPGSPMTLEATGRELGVTRERVRQLEKKLVALLPEVKIDCGIFRQISETLGLNIAINEFPELIFDRGFSSNKSWDLDSFERLAILCGDEIGMAYADALRQTYSKAQSALSNFAELVISKRDGCGIVDREILEEAFPLLGEMSETELEASLKRLFPIVGVSRNVIFAPATADSIAFSLIRNQLDVAPGHRLGVFDAFFGLKRGLSRRSWGTIDRPRDVIRSIAKADDHLRFDEELDQVILLEPEASVDTGQDSIRKSLIKRILESEERALHIFDIIAWAVDSGHKVNTVLHYATHDERLRSEGMIFRMVGVELSEGDQLFLESVADVTYKSNPYVRFDFRSASGELQINPYWMHSGQIFAEQEFVALFGSSPQFVCGACDAPGQNKFQGDSKRNFSGAIAIPQTVINHLIEVHFVHSMQWIPISSEGASLRIF